MRERLLRCSAIRDEYARSIETCIEQTPKPEPGQRFRQVPHVIGLTAFAESYLYEAKNFLRDLLSLFAAVYQCDLKEASAFASLKDTGDGDLVKWAAERFGDDHRLTRLLRSDQDWIAEVIRKRNAVEHPGGYSGTLELHNIRVHPEEPDKFILPTWGRTGCPHSYVLTDFDALLENLLTLAEDLLAEVALIESGIAELRVYQIAETERDKACPIRLRVGLSAEFMKTHFPSGQSTQ